MPRFVAARASWPFDLDLTLIVILYCNLIFAFSSFEVNNRACMYLCWVMSLGNSSSQAPATYNLGSNHPGNLNVTAYRSYAGARFAVRQQEQPRSQRKGGPPCC